MGSYSCSQEARLPSASIDLSAFSGIGTVAINALIKTANRDVIWGVKPGGSVTCAPAVQDGLLYFGSWDCHLYALDWRTGSLAWKFATSIATPSDVDIDLAFAEQAAFTVLHVQEAPVAEERYRDLRPALGSGAAYNARSEYASRSQYASKNPNRYAR